MEKDENAQDEGRAVLYFGIFDPSFGRNKVYIDGLRANGVEVIVCTERTGGWRKYWKLWKRHRALRYTYDLMIVGYPGYTVALFARLIATAPVALDAGWSLYESAILSRDSFRGNPFRVPWIKLIDWVATRSVQTVFVETNRQRDYFIESIGVRPEKAVTLYTGVDGAAFKPDPLVKKNPRFTVLFRGRITPEAGAVHALRAAKLLEKEATGREVDFLIIGFGWDRPMREFEAAMAELRPRNVTWLREQLPLDELRRRMLACHASLGQLEANERLSRTIPHKAYESMALRLPYVTARAEGVEEIFTDGENCLMVAPANAEEIAQRIRQLRDDPRLAAKISDNAYKMYTNYFAPDRIVAPILELLPQE